MQTRKRRIEDNEDIDRGEERKRDREGRVTRERVRNKPLALVSEANKRRERERELPYIFHFRLFCLLRRGLRRAFCCAHTWVQLSSAVQYIGDGVEKRSLILAMRMVFGLMSSARLNFEIAKLYFRSFCPAFVTLADLFVASVRARARIKYNRNQYSQRDKFNAELTPVCR